MRSFRRVLAIAPTVAFATLVPALPSSPASAAQGPGAAAVQLSVVFDTPVAPAECSLTTSTVTGSLTGAVTLDGTTVHGDFDIAGTGAPWWADSCERVVTGDTLFSADISGTDTGGRAIACDDVAVAVNRSGVAVSTGLVLGTCSIDGAGAHDLSGTLLGATSIEPATSTWGRGPATGYTYAGTFLQNVD